jgi:hypothetical protein
MTTGDGERRTLVLEATPPSLNAIAGRGSRHAFSRAKRRWQADLATMLMVRAVPRGLSRVEATALLTFPTRRRRDEGNFRVLLEKALGDALVEGAWLSDDVPEHLTFGSVTFGEGRPCTRVYLRYWNRRSAA